MCRNILLLICCLFLFSTPLFAQEYSTPDELAGQVQTTSEVSRMRFDVGAGYWYTWAALDSYVYDSGLGGQKISELNNDIDAGLFLINADAWILWRIYAGGYIAWGDFDGEHKDSDWILPEEEYISGVTWGEVAAFYNLNLSDPYSVSKSDAKGDVTTWNLNGYLRVIDKPKEDKGYLDLALGYLYYQDDIQHLKNSTRLVRDWVTVNQPVAGHDSSDKYTFKGLRLGVRGKIRLHERVAIKGSAGACLWLNVQEDLFWNLRNDFGNPPGRKDKVDTDGTAYDIDIGIEIKLFEHVFLETGYKYIYLESDKGDIDIEFLSGPTFEVKDAFDVKAHRGGFYGMAKIKF